MKKPVEPTQIKTHIVFAFSRHGTASDFNKFVPLIGRFNPHIWAPENRESVNTPEEAEAIRTLNGLIFAAKKNERVATALRMFAADATDNISYRKAEMEFLIEHPMRWYSIERHTPEGHLRENELLAKSGEYNAQAMRELIEGRAGDAWEVYRLSIQAAVEHFRQREDTILARIPSYGLECREVFPELHDVPTVRVLAQMGSAHVPFFNHAHILYAREPGLLLERVMLRPDPSLENDVRRVEHAMRKHKEPRKVDLLGSLLFEATLNVVQAALGAETALAMEKDIYHHAQQAARQALRTAHWKIEKLGLNIQLVERVLSASLPDF